MERINLNQHLFHGLVPWKSYFYHEKYIDSAEVLQKILNTGLIASNKILKDILSDEEYTLLNMKRVMTWNKDDYVSIVPTIHPEIEGIHSALEDFTYLQEDSKGLAYNFYVKGYPSIVLDSKLLKELEVNEDQGPCMIDEIQIKDRIPSNYFVGVTLPDVPDFDSFFEYMNLVNSTGNGQSQVKYKPWYDEASEDLFSLTEEEFVCKYYKPVMSFEDVLRKTHSNLKLYNVDTGIQIPSSLDKMREVEKVKKKLR